MTATFPWRNIALFAGLVLATICISFLSQRLLMNFAVFYNSFAAQYEQNFIDKLYVSFSESNRGYSGYAWTPLILLLKYAAIAGLFVTGSYFLNYKITFGRALRIAMTADILNVFVMLAKLMYFSFVHTDFSITEVVMFYPLSLYSFTGSDPNSVMATLYQYISLTEVCYWFFLAWVFHKETSLRYNQSLKVVSLTYGAGSIAMVLLLTFLRLG